MKKTKHAVTVADVPVHVYVDDNGRVLYTVAARGVWGDDPNNERVAVLATKTAHDAAVLGAKRTKRKRHSVLAADASAKARTKASEEHWTKEWFERAHAAHPNYGKARLAQHARHLAATARIEPDTKRDEISVERARQFLERQRNQRA